MVGLLNGVPRLTLADGDTVCVGAVVERTIGGDLVSLRREGRRSWCVELRGLSPDPTWFGDSLSCSFAAVEWEARSAIALAGYDACVLVDLDNGVETTRYSLGFTDMSSLDILELGLVNNERWLLVVSTRVVWVVAGDDAVSYRSAGPIASAEVVTPGELTVNELDVGDPHLPVVQQRISLELGE